MVGLKERIKMALVAPFSLWESQIDYYKRVMRVDTARDPITAVGEKGTGHLQLARLKMYGLLPRHTVLDIGCGSLRGGEHIMRYLDTGHYTGTDISPEILAAARARFPEAHLVLTKDMKCEGLGTFDFIHAQSVLSHMAPHDIGELFTHLHKIVKPNTQALFSYFRSDTGSIYSSVYRRNYHYPLSWMQEKGKEHGFLVREVPDAQGQLTKQPLLLITSL